MEAERKLANAEEVFSRARAANERRLRREESTDGADGGLVGVGWFAETLVVVPAVVVLLPVVVELVGGGRTEPVGVEREDSVEEVGGRGASATAGDVGASDAAAEAKTDGEEEEEEDEEEEEEGLSVVVVVVVVAAAAAAVEWSNKGGLSKGFSEIEGEVGIEIEKRRKRGREEEEERKRKRKRKRVKRGKRDEERERERERSPRGEKADEIKRETKKKKKDRKWGEQSWMETKWMGEDESEEKTG